MPPKFKLKLYVSQDNSGLALSRLYKALEHHPYTDYELAIIDISAHREVAEADGVTEVPTLVSILPEGKRIISSVLEDVSLVRKLFGFRERKQ